MNVKHIPQYNNLSPASLLITLTVFVAGATNSPIYKHRDNFGPGACARSNPLYEIVQYAAVFRPCAVFIGVHVLGCVLPGIYYSLAGTSFIVIDAQVDIDQMFVWVIMGYPHVCSHAIISPSAQCQHYFPVETVV